jgi:response regulator RpfG family c-di-GMP phosphodiesterase
MKKKLNIQNLLNIKSRAILYIMSLTSLIFLQTFCTTVCPFIDGLQPEKLFRNLLLIFVAHIIYRETLYMIFKEKKQNISLPRQAYFLSIISWVFAGITAFVLHSFLYPDFPLSSHLKIFTSYITLGAAILAQLEYILFEKRYKEISIDKEYTIFNENLSQKIVETFLIFTIAPITTLLMIIGRYNTDGVIDTHVMLEILYIGLLMIVSAIILALVFGKVLKQDTKIIIENIKEVEIGHYKNTKTINRPDELGKISVAMKDMSKSIYEGILEIESLNEEIINTQKEVIYTMGEIAETRSKETGFHVKRVAEYSYILALKLGLKKDEAELLRLASPMHDIGKIGIPDNILNKPGKLTFEEFEIMKTHGEIGYEMLKHSNKPILKTAAIVSKEHHEKFNGKGYPLGKSGEEIHIYGRITAVADVFDALGTKRVYKEAWPDEKIFKLLRDERGEHFCPRVIDAFFDSLKQINKIRKNNKDV